MTSDIGCDSLNFITISYRSEAQLLDKLHDLVSIVEESRLRNAACGITGVLLFDGTFFLQTLEGPPEKTKGVYAKILQDRRHRNVKSFPIQAIEERDFPDWHMELISSDETAQIVADMGNLEFTYRRLREVQAMSVDVIRQREENASATSQSVRKLPTIMP